MAINQSTGGLQLFDGEIMVQHHEDVQITFKKVKYSCEHLKGTKQGHLYLTNFKLFFVNNKKNDMLQNFTMPFKLIKDFEIKQPVFGANHLEGKILAENGGGWQGSAEFEIKFKAGGAIEVGQSLVKMAQNPRKMYVSQPTIIVARGATQISSYPVDSYAPAVAPSYAPPPAGYHPVAPPVYSASPYPQQPGAYPQQPGAYPQQPGVYPQQYPQQPQPQPTSGMDPKAQEAMASSANNLPPGYSYPPQNPPPYDGSKKYQ